MVHLIFWVRKWVEACVFWEESYKRSVTQYRGNCDLIVFFIKIRRRLGAHRAMMGVGQNQLMGLQT